MEMLITPPNIVSPKVRAFFTTRTFVNNHDHVSEAVAQELHISRDKIYLPVQKHTNRIQVLKADTVHEIADAVVTGRREIFIGILVADCVPILLFDERGVIGAVHAGWRGTAKRILKKTILVMQKEFNCVPEDIRMAIGPSIRPCCYEVDEDVKESVQRAAGEGVCCRQEGNKYRVDLSSANRVQALSMRISPENIWQSEECTFCSPERFYSYRYSKGSNGRQGGFIGMW
jgi:YfiH family protein